MKITVKSKINKNMVQKFNTFTNTGIYRPTKMFRCSDIGSVVKTDPAIPGTQH